MLSCCKNVWIKRKGPRGDLTSNLFEGAARQCEPQESKRRKPFFLISKSPGGLVSWSPWKQLVTLGRLSHQTSFSFLGSTSPYIQARTTRPEWRGHFGKCRTGVGVPDDLPANSRSQGPAVKVLSVHCLLKTNALTVPPADREEQVWGKEWGDSSFRVSTHTFYQIQLFWSCAGARH